MAGAIGHRSAAGRPRRRIGHVPITLRARVFLRRRMLDRLLAAGADPSWDPELALRAARVTGPRRRRALADGLVRAVRDANRPSRWTCAAPLDRAAVRAAAPELRALAAALLQDPAPRPQAITLAEQLVREADSPLYTPGDEDALRESARIAREALERRVDSIERSSQ
jgi:hypothetical protein